jgi:hypothetical protein
MKTQSRDRSQHSRDVYADLTGFFLRSIAAPSQARPTVRCLTRADALALALQARDAIAEPSIRRLSGVALLELLERSRVLEVGPIVPAEGSREGMYTVGVQPSDTIDPLELLQAAEPAGLVCYFTALAFHGLTTQSPTHHHIATLVDRPRQSPSTAPRVPVGDTGPKRSRDALGKLRFTFQSVRYYETSRALHTVAGIQLRHLNDRSMVRITTREQALLDTLHRPVSCGGLSVVWEAWETGLSNLDEARLHEHLVALEEPRHVRRVGYLLEAFRYTPAATLGSLLERARTDFAADSAAQVVPLFPGLPAVTMNTVWRLEVPTP